MYPKHKLSWWNLNQQNKIKSRIEYLLAVRSDKLAICLQIHIFIFHAGCPFPAITMRSIVMPSGTIPQGISRHKPIVVYLNESWDDLAHIWRPAICYSTVFSTLSTR